MKIELIKDGPINGMPHRAGDIVEIDDVFGARLIRRGAAMAPTDRNGSLFGDSDGKGGATPDAGPGKRGKGGGRKKGGKGGPSQTADQPGPKETRNEAEPSIEEMKAFAEAHAVELPEEELDRDALQQYIVGIMQRRMDALGEEPSIEEMKAFAEAQEITLPGAELDEPALKAHIWKAIDAMAAGDE